MIQKSIIRLIDEAILPASIMVLAKSLGIILISYVFNFEFILKTRSFLGIFPSVQYSTIENYIKAENYSNLIMLLVVSLGAIIVIIRAHFLHESHIHPNLHSKLASYNLEKLIAPSYKLYHQAIIWLMFLWLTVGFLTISTLANVTYIQISFIAFLIAANLSWVFAVDVEKEINISTGRI